MSLYVHVIFIPIKQIWAIHHARPNVKESNSIHTYYLERMVATRLVSNSHLELCIRKIGFGSTLTLTQENQKCTGELEIY